MLGGGGGTGLYFLLSSLWLTFKRTRTGANAVAG